MANQEWYSVRSIFRSDMTEDGRRRRAFEERVVLFRAASFEEALAKGETEAKRYAEAWPHPKVLDRLVAFSIQAAELREGEEGWSSSRYREITAEERLQR